MSDLINMKLNGPILDVDYEWDPAGCQRRVLTLQDLCGKKIVSDSYVTRSHIAFMPDCIKTIIMHSAFAEGRLPTIAVVLKHWPYNTFKFPQLPVLKEWLLACSSLSWMRLSKSLQKALKCASLVLNVFLEIVRKGGMETRLMFLDLSAVPLSENLVLRICEFISDCYQLELPNANAGNSSTVQKYTIKVHCVLNSHISVEKLYSALLKDAMGLSVIRLSVCGLTFGNNSLCKDQRALDLIRLIDPSDFQIVSFNFVGILPVSLNEVLGRLASFHNLRVLDFSYFPTQSGNFLIALQTLLRELVHISRIDISNCNVRNGIGSLLKHMNQSNSVPTDSDGLSIVHKKPKFACSNPYCQGFPSGNLEYLNLSGCKLSSHDLEYLANSPQAQTLKYLNVCDNTMVDKFNSLLMLLRALAPSLHVLEIAGTYFVDEQMDELIFALSEMTNLRFLNISNSRTSPETLLQHLPGLCRLPHLKMLGLCMSWFVAPTQVLDFRTRVVKLIKNEGSNVDVLWLR